MPDEKPSSFYSEVSTTDDDNEQESSLRSSVLWWRAKQVEQIVINSTESDQNQVIGFFAVFSYISVWLMGAFVLPLGLILLLTGFYIIGGVLAVLVLLCYVLPIRVSPTIRFYARRNFCRYFKEASIRFEHVPDPRVDRPTVFCISPHGVFSLSWCLCYLTEELHHAYYCFSTVLRLNPFLRVLTQLLGKPSDAKKATVIDHLKNGRSIALIPGAWHEASLHNSEIDRLYIKKRQGFVKYALQFGCTITPTYCFGEKSTYSNLQGCYRFRFWLNDRRILATLPFGRWWCFWLPRPVKIHTVIGAPIQLPHIPNPTREEVHQWHQTYIDEMVELYDRYKIQFYGPEAENQRLEIW